MITSLRILQALKADITLSGREAFSPSKNAGRSLATKLRWGMNLFF